MLFPFKTAGMVTIVLSLAFPVVAISDERPDYSIADIMNTAHKKPEELLKRVARGTASQGERAKLLELYRQLAKKQPPKGDPKSWQERTGLLIAAADAANKGEKDAGRMLYKAANCMACHQIHK